MTRLSFNINEKEKSKFASLAASEGLTINQWAKHCVYKHYKNSIESLTFVNEAGPSKILSCNDVLKESMDIAKLPVEHFYVFTLNSSHAIIKKHFVTKGLANTCLVHPREVFLCAIEDRAVAIICVHNHPGGDTTPSPQDNNITRRLALTSNIISIDLLDHIIITPNAKYSSYLELGLLQRYKDEAKSKLGF